VVTFVPGSARDSELGSTARCCITWPTQRSALVRHVADALTSPATAAESEVPAYPEFRGYPSRCRLAGYWGGRLHVYLAQHNVHGQSAPLPCAL